MAEDMTLGELARLIERVEHGQQAMRQELSQRLDRTVSTDIYTVQHRAVMEEIAELKAAHAKGVQDFEDDVAQVREEVRAEARQRIADRRWWLTAIGIPVAALVLQYAGPLLGVGE
ncbi:hypothetical protein [Streptomonospora nanhaiensis]|uniref:hypothetical protein n=1 Tax=Streptomonospora nanhaiensis TaxID=1323731 RepID=UPI001C3877BC|nr:hypothetical protein [Streptomonospora nanhaiensis]MBV2364256.1 hypothetical protein [Streptomonospora nanhaiensis]